MKVLAQTPQQRPTLKRLLDKVQGPAKRIALIDGGSRVTKISRAGTDTMWWLEQCPPSLFLREWMMRSAACRSLLTGLASVALGWPAWYQCVAEGLQPCKIYVGKVPVVELTPLNLRHPKRAVVHIHGGGFVLLDALPSLRVAAAFAEGWGVKVFSVDYTLAPKATIPDQIDQVLDVVENLRKDGYDEIILVGESAGGALAMLAARRKPGLISGVVGISPWVNLDRESEIFHANEKTDVLLSRDLVHVAADLSFKGICATKSKQSLSHKRVWKNYPRTFLTYSAIEAFEPSLNHMFHKMTRAGVVVDRVVYEGLCHDFPTVPTFPIPGTIPETHDIVNDAGKFFGFARRLPNGSGYV